MNNTRIKWKFVFFLMVAIFAFAVFDTVTTPDIIAPTHPEVISAYILFIDAMILLGTYNYAFEKKIIPIIPVWSFVFFSLYIINIVIIGYEFYNRSDGYEVYEMMHVSIIKLCIVAFMSYPTYLYYTRDLA